MLAAILLFFNFSFALLPVPNFTSHLNDQAGLLSPQEKSNLKEKLERIERETSAQVGVLIIKNLEGESIESYSMRVAEKVKFGTEKKDNGILLVVSLDDKKMRIEVGYGLEGSLSDIKAARIIRYSITPFFKKGQFYKGIFEGVDAIERIIRGGESSEPSYGVTRTQENSVSSAGFLIFFLFITFFSLFSPNIISHFFFGFPFFAFLGTVGVSQILLITCLGFYFIILPIIKIYLRSKGIWGPASGKSSAYRSSNGWGHHGGGGGFGGGGFGGGGFGGGGGGFGGGGASGGW